MKKQSRVQRIQDADWLRSQLEDLRRDCVENIEQDQASADNARSDERVRYLTRVEVDTHYKRQIDRILGGLTSAESIALMIRTGRRV